MRSGLHGCGYAVTVALIIAITSCGHESTGPTPVCSYAIAPATQGFANAGGTGSVTVTTAAGCAWSASAGTGWITISAGASGNGPGTVAYSVEANADTGARTGSLTIAGQPHTVTQEGRPAPAPICTYAISPSGATFSKDEATGSFGVTAPAGCAWSAASAASWITISSGQGSGDGTVTYAITRNFDVDDRQDTIAVADRTFTVRQIGDPPAPVCAYAVTPTALSVCFFGFSGGQLHISAQAGCPWTVRSAVPWMATSVTSGEGTQTVRYTVDSYTSAPTRKGQLEVRWPTPTQGQNVWVTQTGCNYAIGETSKTFTAAGDPRASLAVFGTPTDPGCDAPMGPGCPWTASTDSPTWITLTRTIGYGDDFVRYAVAALPSGTGTRVGRITVAGLTLTITQNR